MLVKKVYEGTIPDKFFNISVFTDEIIKESDIDAKTIINQFRKIKMSFIKIMNKYLYLNRHTFK